MATLLRIIVSALIALIALMWITDGGWCAETTYDLQTPTTKLPHAVGTITRVHLHVPEQLHGDVQIVVLKPTKIRASLLDQSPTFPIGAMTVKQVCAQTADAIVVVNGGYFNPQFQAMGLLKLHGQELQPLSDKAVLSGIVGIDTAGKLSLLERHAPHALLHEAIQAGPFIIDPGGMVGVKPRPVRAQRTILAENKQGDIIVLVTAPFSLHDIASFMLEHQQLMGGHAIERALNLDGGPSTGMACILPPWNWDERGPVRNMIIIRPALSD